MCMLCFTSPTISSTYEDLAYSFWLPAGYNTMVTFPAIVSGIYAFIFPIESTDYLGIWLFGYTEHSL